MNFTNTSPLSQVKKYVKLFQNNLTPKKNRHYNIRAYIKTLEYVKNSWVFAVSVPQKTFQKL